MNIAQSAPRSRPRHQREQRRTHCVSVRVNDMELHRLTQWAQGSRRKLGQLLRDHAFGATPQIVPEVNRHQWVELSRALSNLNQIAHALNQGRIPGDIRPLLLDLYHGVVRLRADLRGDPQTP